MEDIQKCQHLVDQIEDEYHGDDRFSLIGTIPGKIIQNAVMGLWAQSLSGEKLVDMGLPSLKAWLKRLAASGPGVTEEYFGIRYTFVKQDPCDSSTS